MGRHRPTSIGSKCLESTSRKLRSWLMTRYVIFTYRLKRNLATQQGDGGS